MLSDADATPGAVLCPFCGGPERVQIFETWGHEFMLETCCEAIHEQVAAEMSDDRAWARRFLRHLYIEDISGHEIRRIADDGCCGLILDWQLRIEQVSAARARRFIADHHAHCAAPVAWRFHVAVFNGRTMIGVAVVGNPVARALSGRDILEVNRLCVRRDTPSALRWNAASMLYGWCAREAERRGWQKVITYTRADEPGTSLIAAGWIREGRVRGRGWHSTVRHRSNRNSWIDKVRWSRTLAPRPRNQQSTETTPCAASASIDWLLDESAFS